jgi:glycosyltransferase involved in cell wall biosynthesis
VVVDDGSTDCTVQVAAEFVSSDRRFRLIQKSNGGLASARNAALRIAQGELIQLLDADDMLEPRKLELQVALFQERKDIAIIYSDVLLFKNGVDEPPKLLQFRDFGNAAPPSGHGEIIVKLLVEDNFFLCPLFRREVLDEIGLFREELKALEDWHFWSRAALANFAVHHDGRAGARLLCRDHGGNMSGNREKMWRSRIAARRDILKIVEASMADALAGLPQEFLRDIALSHRKLLAKELARCSLLYGNPLAGAKEVMRDALLSGRWYSAFYDGAYWTKERLKRLSS